MTGTEIHAGLPVDVEQFAALKARKLKKFRKLVHHANVVAVENRLHEILQQKGLGNVTFEVPIVDDIPLNPRTRKFQLIVSD